MGRRRAMGSNPTAAARRSALVIRKRARERPSGPHGATGPVAQRVVKSDTVEGMISSWRGGPGRRGRSRAGGLVHAADLPRVAAAAGDGTVERRGRCGRARQVNPRPRYTTREPRVNSREGVGHRREALDRPEQPEGEPPEPADDGEQFLSAVGFLAGLVVDAGAMRSLFGAGAGGLAQPQPTTRNPDDEAARSGDPLVPHAALGRSGARSTGWLVATIRIRTVHRTVSPKATHDRPGRGVGAGRTQ